MGYRSSSSETEVGLSPLESSQAVRLASLQALHWLSRVSMRLRQCIMRLLLHALSRKKSAWFARREFTSPATAGSFGSSAIATEGRPAAAPGIVKAPLLSESGASTLRRNVRLERPGVLHRREVEPPSCRNYGARSTPLPPQEIPEPSAHARDRTHRREGRDRFASARIPAASVLRTRVSARAWIAIGDRGLSARLRERRRGRAGPCELHGTQGPSRNGSCGAAGRQPHPDELGCKSGRHTQETAPAARRHMNRG